ncbi:hypothetical protein Bbelb_200060 [Branchiostoma belcheri]|nr:hypothetical protein Bbelb_200060 [Branchiostoma belcheri]
MSRETEDLKSIDGLYYSPPWSWLHGASSMEIERKAIVSALSRSWSVLHDVPQFSQPSQSVAMATLLTVTTADLMRRTVRLDPNSVREAARDRSTWKPIFRRPAHTQDIRMHAPPLYIQNTTRCIPYHPRYQPDRASDRPKAGGRSDPREGWDRG